MKHKNMTGQLIGFVLVLHQHLNHADEAQDRPVGLAVTRSSLEREVWGSNLGPVKSDTVLPTARHRCDISSKGAVLPGRNDAEMGLTNSLHAPAHYNEYNERFDEAQA